MLSSTVPFASKLPIIFYKKKKEIKEYDARYRWVEPDVFPYCHPLIEPIYTLESDLRCRHIL